MSPKPVNLQRSLWSRQIGVTCVSCRVFQEGDSNTTMHLQGTTVFRCSCRYRALTMRRTALLCSSRLSTAENFSKASVGREWIVYIDRTLQKRSLSNAARRGNVRTVALPTGWYGRQGRIRSRSCTTGSRLLICRHLPRRLHLPAKPSSTNLSKWLGRATRKSIGT